MHPLPCPLPEYREREKFAGNVSGRQLDYRERDQERTPEGEE